MSSLEDGLRQPARRWMRQAARPGLVSVIIPTYNRSHLLRRAVNSVMAQSYRPIEIIIVDDGSTDDTRSVVHELANNSRSNDIVVRYIRQSNSGAPSARNLGLCKSRGEFIQFMDSDDVLMEHKLSAQVRALAGSNADFAYSSLVWSANISSSIYDKAISYNDRFRPTNDITSTIVSGIFKRQSCIRLGPWNEVLKRYQDWEYSVRADSLGFRCIRSPGVGYVAISHCGERIDDGGSDIAARLNHIWMAADAVWEDLGDRANAKVRKRVSQILMSALVISGDAGRLRDANSSVSKIRRIGPPIYTRIKGEIIYFSALAKLMRSRTISAFRSVVGRYNSHT